MLICYVLFQEKRFLEKYFGFWFDLVQFWFKQKSRMRFLVNMLLESFVNNECLVGKWQVVWGFEGFIIFEFK